MPLTGPVSDRKSAKA